MTMIELFNKCKRDSLWNRKGERMRRRFKMQLMKYKPIMNGEFTDDEIMRVAQSDIGYNGIGVNEYSKIISEYAYNNPNESRTKDHYFGTTSIAEFVLESFRENDFDVDYMVNEWLYEHLYLWALIRITRKEHKQDNLARNEHTFDEKLEGLHYEEAGIVIREDVK